MALTNTSLTLGLNAYMQVNKCYFPKTIENTLGKSIGFTQPHKLRMQYERDTRTIQCNMTMKQYIVMQYDNHGQDSVKPFPEHLQEYIKTMASDVICKSQCIKAQR